MPSKPTASRRIATQDIPRIKRVCEQCGKTFSLAPFRLKRSPCRFCSRHCWRESTRTGEYHNCEVCGKSFYVGGKEIKTRSGRWCSMACSRIPQRRGLNRECRTCGKKFYVQQGHLKKSEGNGFYCSQICKGPRVRELKFRGGKQRYGTNWVAQAESARERDNYECQSCGRPQGKRKLHVHHIESRRSFGSDYLSANDLSNLVTLCARCHIRVETEGNLIP